jgi:methyl-accepting chemotaxis protein
MNVDAFIESHAEWKMRLRVLLDSGAAGGLRADDFEAGDRCDLGRWIYGEGRRFADDLQFQALERLHREFHRAAAEVIRFVAEGRRLEAEALLTGDYARHSASLVGALSELGKHAGTDDGE